MVSCRHFTVGRLACEIWYHLRLLAAAHHLFLQLNICILLAPEQQSKQQHQHTAAAAAAAGPATVICTCVPHRRLQSAVSSGGNMTQGADITPAAAGPSEGDILMDLMTGHWKSQGKLHSSHRPLHVIVPVYNTWDRASQQHHDNSCFLTAETPDRSCIK